MPRPILRMGARNPDVGFLQQQLNAKLAPSPRLVVDQDFGPNTDTAVRRFQQACGLRTDGIVGPKTWGQLEAITAPAPQKLAPSNPSPNELEFTPWVGVARNELGVKEDATLGKNNPRILEYIGTFSYLNAIEYTQKGKATGHKMGDVDETPWCACFVNWCLTRAGKAAGPSARAKDWLSYGSALAEPRFGCIAVVYHAPGASTAGTTSSGNHVAFFTAGTAKNLTLLGGNQGNQVSEKNYGSYWSVLGFRWPP